MLSKIKSLYSKLKKAILINKLKSQGVEIKDSKTISLTGKVEFNLEDSAKLIIDKNVSLSDCKIIINSQSKLIIGSGSIIKGTKINMSNGSIFNIKEKVLIEEIQPYKQYLFLDNAKVNIGQESRIRCSTRVQYGGQLNIGKSTFINEGTDIRADNLVEIGDYTIISYGVDIFDTNTHSTSWRDRYNAIASSSLHKIEGEAKPKNKPIRIGNYCWIGKKAAILKGVTLEDKVIVALGAVVNSSVPEEYVAYGNPAKSKPINHN